MWAITLQAPTSVLRTGLFGHAILNLADSIAIAVEFQHASRLIPFTMAEWFNLPVKAEEWGSGTQFAGSHAMDPFFTEGTIRKRCGGGKPRRGIQTTVLGRESELVFWLGACSSVRGPSGCGS